MQVLKYLGKVSTLLFALAASPLALGVDEGIDYAKLDLTIQLSRMRAGVHDPSGENSYFFETTVYGLPVLKDEIKKDFASRLKIEKRQGDFGQTQIKNLKYWIPGKKPDPKDAIAIPGDVVREVVAETMRSFQVPEDQVAILIRTVMYEGNKKLMFFGEDLKIGESDFYLIPESLPHIPNHQSTTLHIKDALGTAVELSIIFKTQAESATP